MEYSGMKRSPGDEGRFMQRCLELASIGTGYTYPNPLVGSLLVYDGRIIGEGYHSESGKPHAEVNAISSVADTTLLQGSTLYVNLEPCCHTGRTPPCTDLIMQSGIPKVVIGCRDPNPAVAGSGIERLQREGVEVVYGVLEQESKEVNRRFITFHEKRRPYIVLKWAESRDGFLDRERSPGEPPGPNWITGEIARTLVHKWRASEQAIMVGSRTVATDNPELTLRYWAGKQPLRITVSRLADLPDKAYLLDNKSPTLVYTGKVHSGRGKTEFVKIDFNREVIGQILDDLYSRGIQSVLIEGGRRLLDSMISSGMWDEARVFTGNEDFHRGIKAPGPGISPVYRMKFDNAILSGYRNEILITPG